MTKPLGGSLLVLVLLWALGAPLAAQNGVEPSFAAVVAEAVLADGYWDETDGLDDAAMDSLVEQFGDDFAFVYTERSFEVQQDPNQNPAALLSQAILDSLTSAGGPQTVLFVTGDHTGGATNSFPFFNVNQVMASFDRASPVSSFQEAATELLVLGDNLAPIPDGLEPTDASTDSSAEDTETGIFAGMRILIILAIVAAVLALASVISARNKRVRRVITTADARDSTKDEIQAMSDLILDLDPRVTLADDADLKERFVDASSTYRDVLEKAEEAVTGHEVADLRISISKARWKLDVIDAELSGRTPPKEPFTRDNSGSAWDSTRGSGNNT